MIMWLCISNNNCVVLTLFGANYANPGRISPAPPAQAPALYTLSNQRVGVDGSRWRSLDNNSRSLCSPIDPSYFTRMKMDLLSCYFGHDSNYPTLNYLKHKFKEHAIILPGTPHTCYVLPPNYLHVSQVLSLTNLKPVAAPCRGRGRNQVSPKNNRIQCTNNSRIAEKMSAFKLIDFRSLVCIIYISARESRNTAINTPGCEQCPGNADPRHKSDPAQRWRF